MEERLGGAWIRKLSIITLNISTQVFAIRHAMDLPLHADRVLLFQVCHDEH